MRLLAAAAALAGCIACGAAAQTYPVRPVRLISSLPVSSNGDVAGRLQAPKMAERLGQPVVFESRTGATGNIAAGAVASAAPDGYTLLYVGAGTLVTNRFLVKNVPFDALKDFSPVSQASRAVTFFAANAALPVNSIQDLIDYAKRNPGKLSYGSTGPGSPFNLMGETFKSAAGVDIVHVPYSGANAALALNDLLTGRLQLYFASYTLIRQHLGSGKVRLLSTTDASRFRKLPDVPAITETVPDFRPVPSWNGFLGPAGLAPEVVARVHDAIIASLQDAGIAVKLDDLGITPIGNSPAEFARAMHSDIERFAEVARMLGIQPQ